MDAAVSDSFLISLPRIAFVQFLKEYKVGSKGNLVVYAIDGAGEVEKTIVYKKTPYGVVRGVLRADGKIALFTQNGSRTRIVELKAL